MAFGAIELTTITRSQDYSTIKQNEDNRAALSQANGQLQVEKNENQKNREIHRSDNAEWHRDQQDAREKGKNEYNGDGGAKREKQPRERMVVKGRSGFDIRI
ncbi:MAG: hypothetical protein ACI4HQ_01920 [Acetatifactor sp.]